MKLNELVLLRNKLQEAINSQVIQAEVAKNKYALEQLYSISSDHYHPIIGQLISEQEKINSLLSMNKESLLEKLNVLNADIEYLTKRFFTDNYQLECKWNNAAAVRQYRIMPINSETDDLLLNRVRLYSTWEYPALEIGCRDGHWTKYLVSSDPLYISDDFNEFLETTSKQFTKEYQARLRKYNIVDYKINGLPTNQFGFIFSFNYFNYLSLDTIKQFLIQAKEWLRPGGIMLFTYNNADIDTCAGLAENYFMTYVPKTMLVPMIESLGFDIIKTLDLPSSTCWVEIKKPGVLQTVKAHQALGEIKYR